MFDGMGFFIMEIELYGKYKDKHNRLFIVIERSGKINVQNGNVTITPSTIKVLNVAEETVKQFDHYVFLNYIEKNILTRIK